MNKPLTKGFSLVEVLIAVFIISIAMFAVISTASKAIAVSRQALIESQMALLLEEGAEATKSIRDNNWTTISNLTIGSTYYLVFSSGAWSLTTTPNTIDQYTRTVQFGSVYRNGTDDIASSGTLDAGTKYVTVSVSVPNAGSTLTKTLSFYMSQIF